MVNKEDLKLGMYIFRIDYTSQKINRELLNYMEDNGRLLVNGREPEKFFLSFEEARDHFIDYILAQLKRVSELKEEGK